MYQIDWQTFTQRPDIARLIQEHGIDRARQAYLRETTPYIPTLLESNQPGLSINASMHANDAKSTQFITGYSKETSKFVFESIGDGFVDDIDGSGFDVYAYNGSVDFSRGHVNSIKKIRFLITSGSNSTYTFDNASCVITASVDDVTGDAEEDLITAFRNAINQQLSTATLAGFTNTFAPSDIISGSASGRELTITREHNAGVPNITIFAGPNAVNLSATASVSTPIEGRDTYHFQPGVQVFDGSQLPYAAMPRK